MHFAFIDDTQQQPPLPRNGVGHLVGLGAVIVPEDSLKPFTSELETIKTALGIPKTEEIKWKSKKGSFLARAGPAVQSELRRRVLDAAYEHDIRATVMLVDHSIRYTYYDTEKLGAELLEWIYERITMNLDPAEHNCVIIADKPGGGSREDRKWLTGALNLTENGTKYVKPGRVVLPVMTAHSDLVPLLQLADLATAATAALVAGRSSGLQLKDVLYKLYIRNNVGCAGNAGIKIFPDTYRNLYHEIFGETKWMRSKTLQFETLPVVGEPYYFDDGISES